MIASLIKFFIKREYLVYGLFLICTLVTLLLTLLPPSSLQAGAAVFQYDKLGHFLMFFGWTLMFGLSWMIRKKSMVNLWVVFFIGAAFGVSIEVAQGLLPYDRYPDIHDAIADILGSLSAVLVLRFLQKNYSQLFVKQVFTKK